MFPKVLAVIPAVSSTVSPPPPPALGPSGALTLLLVDVGGQVGRVGAVAEVVVAVRDERGERVDSVGRLHDGNFVGLQERRGRGLSGRRGPGCKEPSSPASSEGFWGAAAARGLGITTVCPGHGRKHPFVLK